MPVINGVYTKDFPNLGRDLVDSDIIVVAIPGNNVTYKTTYGALKTYINLANLVPYTGATTDVNLGTHSLSAESITLDPTPATIPTAQGSLYFDDDELTLAVVLNGTVQKVGEDVFFQIKNQSGSTIPKGTAVRFDGVVGASGRILAVPFLADGTYPSIYFLGITSEEIANGGDGKAYMTGKIRGINTNAYAVGTILYCSTTVAGGYQTTAPVAPNNIISVAAVVTQGTSNGTLLVRPTLGSNINRDEGVLITSPTTGDLLQLQSDGLWKNKTVASLGLVPTSRTLTINGTAYDLSADRTWSVGTVTSVAALTLGTSGNDLSSTVANGTTTPVITLNVPDASATARGVITTGTQTIAGAKTLTGLLSGTTISLSDTGQFFQNIGAATVSKFVRIGNTSADLSFGVEGSASTIISAVNGGVAYSTVLTTNNSTSLILGTSGVAAITIASNQGVTFSNAVTNLGGLKVQTSTNGTNGISFGTSSVNYHTIIYDDSTKKLNFNTDGTTRAITFSNSNIVIGSTTDSGYKLDVNGTARITGALTGASATFTASVTPLILKSTSATTMWSEYYYNTSTLSGYIGSGSGILTGANNSDFIVRSEADFVVATGGNNRRLTISSSGQLEINSQTAANDNIFKLFIDNTVASIQATYNTTGSYVPIRFLTSDTERMRITSAGNVGIGTTSPGDKLEVIGRAKIVDSSQVPLTLDNTGQRYTQMDFKQNNVQKGSFYTDGTAGYFNIYATNGWGQIFHANAAEAMRITSGGNLGIGTTSPNAKFEVAGTSANTDFRISRTVSSAVYLSITAPGGTPNTSTFGVNGTDVLSINASGNALIGTTTDAGYKLDVNGTGRFSGNLSLSSSSLYFGLGNGGGNESAIWLYNSNAASRSWRILKDLTAFGDFQIQQSTTQTGSTYADILRFSPTGAATFSSSVTATGFFESSSILLKDIISRDGDVAYFKWKNKQDNKVHIGYIAEEVQLTNPDQVNSDGEYLAVNYIELLVQKVRDLEKEIQLLKGKING